MTAMVAADLQPIEGRARPRIAPPRPLHTKADELIELAHSIGIDFIPAQKEAALYLEAVDADERHLFREVAIIEGRQNGKTEILIPHVVRRLLLNRRIMHTAQNRELPREVHGRVADIFESKYAKLVRSIRWANGQEEIKLKGGGQYRIVAPSRGGARGPANDDVIIDELREMTTHDFIAAAKPTMSARLSPQMVYLSNMGDESSEVLNALKARSLEDHNLAYLEWSAAPERKPDDLEGWLEANPGIGHLPRKLENLRDEYQANFLGGTMAVFETEFLCRKVLTMRERLVHDQAWADCEGEVGKPSRPMLGVSMSPDGTRASAVIAWAVGEKAIHLQVLFDVTGDPIDTAALGRDIREKALRMGVIKTGFDPITDAELAKFWKKPEAITGRLFQNASARFVAAVEGKELRWQDADAVTEDLPFTSRKAHTDTSTFEAVRASDDHPITAILAAIRAVWLASGPRLKPTKAF